MEQQNLRVLHCPSALGNLENLESNVHHPVPTSVWRTTRMARATFPRRNKRMKTVSSVHPNPCHFTVVEMMNNLINVHQCTLELHGIWELKCQQTSYDSCVDPGVHCSSNVWSCCRSYFEHLRGMFTFHQVTWASSIEGFFDCGQTLKDDTVDLRVSNFACYIIRYIN